MIARYVTECNEWLRLIVVSIPSLFGINPHMIPKPAAKRISIDFR